MPNKPFVSIRNLSKNYSGHGVSLPVLEGFNLDIPEGSFTAIFGPNGCGKTTLINLIAGLDSPDTGTITIIGSPPRIGLAFQNYAESLMPWLTCLDNIALAVPLDSLAANERREVARLVLQSLNLGLPTSSYPHQLSGGQKQLTCIARAIARRPNLLLLDEAFSSVDYENRFRMYKAIQKIRDELDLTIVFTSHDMDEALLLSDQLVLLPPKPVRIAQLFDNNLPRPRLQEIQTEPEYTTLRRNVLREFSEAARQ